MPQPRKHKTNADRQRAYRARVAERAAAERATALSLAQSGPTRGQQALVDRLTAQDDRARAGEAY